MDFIDMHTHLQDIKSDSIANILEKASKAGVRKIVCASVVEADWSKIAALALEYPDIIVPAFGLHPWYVAQATEGWVERMEMYLEAFPNSVIGETGLDALKEDMDTQKKVFKSHLDIAKKYQRGVIIHSVKADFGQFWKDMPQRFIFHSFKGDIQQFAKIVELDGYFSFGTSVLRHEDAPEIISLIPSNRILLETDAPYQPKNKGEESLPEMLPELCDQIARWRCEKEDELSAQIYLNSEEFLA